MQDAGGRAGARPRAWSWWGSAPGLEFRVGFWNRGLEGVQMIFGRPSRRPGRVDYTGSDRTRPGIVVMGIAAAGAGSPVGDARSMAVKLAVRVNESRHLLSTTWRSIPVPIIYGAWQDSKTGHFHPSRSSSAIRAVCRDLGLGVSTGAVSNRSLPRVCSRLGRASSRAASYIGSSAPIPAWPRWSEYRTRTHHPSRCRASGAMAGLAGFATCPEQESRRHESFSTAIVLGV